MTDFPSSRSPAKPVSLTTTGGSSTIPNVPTTFKQSVSLTLHLSPTVSYMYNVHVQCTQCTCTYKCMCGFVQCLYKNYTMYMYIHVQVSVMYFIVVCILTDFLFYYGEYHCALSSLFTLSSSPNLFHCIHVPSSPGPPSTPTCKQFTIHDL